jgi:predicted site-specific integrase-resolvase
MAEFEVGGMTFDRWLESIGRSRVTGWRWVELGMLQTVNINGKNYITREEDERFWQRAKAGEFAQEIQSIQDKVAARTQADGD